MKVVDRANQLLDQRLPKEAVATLIDSAPAEQKVKWFDEVPGQHLIYQLANERKKNSESEGSG